MEYITEFRINVKSLVHLQCFDVRVTILEKYVRKISIPNTSVLPSYAMTNFWACLLYSCRHCTYNQPIHALLECELSDFPSGWPCSHTWGIDISLLRAYSLCAVSIHSMLPYLNGTHHSYTQYLRVYF